MKGLAACFEDWRVLIWLLSFLDQVDLIRQVMMNVSLPSAAIPDWANNVPEDKWKAMLVSNIENRNQQKEDTDRNTRR